MLGVTLSSSAQNGLISPLADRFHLSAQHENKHSLLPIPQDANQHAKNVSLHIVLHSNGLVNYRNSIPDSNTSARQILWKPFDYATVGVQALSGLAVTAIIFIPTDYLANRNRGGSSWIQAGDEIMVVGITIAAVALPLAIYHAGNRMGGNGNKTWAFVGTCGAAGVAMMMRDLRESESRLIWMSAAGIVGAIVGYHLSSSIVYESNEKASLRLFPPLKGEAQMSSIGPIPRHHSFQVALLSIAL